MSIMHKVIFIVLALLVTSSAEAQILGQQSLSQSSYVIDKDGQLWAWGLNFYGQLGLGDRTNRTSPMKVPMPAGVSRWVLIAGGANHAIAVGDSDKLYAWGLNDQGQIGVGYIGGFFVSPMLIPNPPGVKKWIAVSAGADHCEALSDDGVLWAWGNNQLGQLGTGRTCSFFRPERVHFPSEVTAWTAVAAGPGYTLMISQDGHLYGAGQDSLGAFLPSPGPQPLNNVHYRGRSPLPCVAASNKLELRIDEEYYAASNYIPPKARVGNIGPDGGVSQSQIAVAAGGNHFLVLNKGGIISSFGDNTYGQLGPPTYMSAFTLRYKMVSQFVAVAAGLNHSLAIGDDGWLYAWGDNTYGELGYASTNTFPGPETACVCGTHRVMQVADSCKISATISAPDLYADTNYTVTLTVHNPNSTSLRGVESQLYMGSPLRVLDSADRVISKPIASGYSDSVQWPASANPILHPQPQIYRPNYFAYVRAPGSAPLIVSGSMMIPVLPYWRGILASISDSVTSAPIPYAQLSFAGYPYTYRADTLTSDNGGAIQIPYAGSIFYEFTISKENYISNVYDLQLPTDNDTFPHYTLPPSGIIGNFTKLYSPLLLDTLSKVYFTDSMVGYAISRRAIFQTTNAGAIWNAVYESNCDLHDVKFLNSARGFVCGDNGTILKTRDSGKTWTSTTIATSNLRSIALVNYDTAWVVGDNGTVIMKSGEAWLPQISFPEPDLTGVHFFDANNGAIVGDSACYLYNGYSWVRYANPILGTLRAVYYASPRHLFVAGNNGKITDLITDGFKPFVTYATHAINSLYFINKSVGYAVGDSGSSLVTYDAGQSWAGMANLPRSSTAVNFFRTNGHGVMAGRIMDYIGAANSISGIVRGRITVGKESIGVLGAVVVKNCPWGCHTDTVYSNEQGNFVFTGVDSLPHNYTVYFADSGTSKQKTFENVIVNHGDIVTLDWNDYVAPPPPNSVGSGAMSSFEWSVVPSPSTVSIYYDLPQRAQVSVELYDALGRKLRSSDGYMSEGIHELSFAVYGLPSGTYYCKLSSPEFSYMRAVTILH